MLVNFGPAKSRSNHPFFALSGNFRLETLTYLVDLQAPGIERVRPNSWLVRPSHGGSAPPKIAASVQRGADFDRSTKVGWVTCDVERLPADLDDFEHRQVAFDPLWGGALGSARTTSGSVRPKPGPVRDPSAQTRFRGFQHIRLISASSGEGTSCSGRKSSRWSHFHFRRRLAEFL